MDDAEFWRLIEHVNLHALHEEDDEGAMETLVEVLSRTDEETIIGFEEQLAQLLFRLDHEKYVELIGDIADSDDGFLYCRCYVVCQGRSTYESVLENPSVLSGMDFEWGEALLYVASTAWARLTGREMEEWDYETSVSYETGSNTEGWPD